MVEDEVKAATYLARGLLESGYDVDTVHDGGAALAAARDNPYALIITDITMPGIDGLALIVELRRIGHDAPVLFVTARNEIDSRVRALDLGGDDYIVKPYAFAELLARVRVLLRRFPARQTSRLMVSDLVLDVVTRRVERGGQRVELTPKEFALLQFFLEHPGEVLSRGLIAERVWDMHFDSGTNVVDVQVKRLRSKIEVAGKPALIHTVRGMGYVLDDREGGGG